MDRPEITDEMRARALDAFIKRIECQLGIQGSDGDLRERLTHSLRKAMTKPVDPKDYAALWWLREHMH